MEQHANPYEFKNALPEVDIDDWDNVAAEMKILLDYRFPMVGMHYINEISEIFYLESKTYLKVMGPYRMKIRDDGKYYVAFEGRELKFIDGGRFCLWLPQMI